MTVTEVGGVTLPLDTYFISAQDRFVVYQAMDILVDKCMAQQGFQFRLGVPTTASEVQHRYFLPVNLSNAEEYGYNIPLPAPKHQLVGTHMDHPTAAERAVLVGTTKKMDVSDRPGGCMGEADAVLAHGVPVAKISMDTLFQWQNAAYDSATADGRYLAAVQKWRRCMATSGYQFSSPNEAYKDGFNRSGAPSQADVMQAVTDVKCKRLSRTADVGFTLMAAYEQRTIEAHAEELAAFVKQQKVQAQNAARIVAGQAVSGSAPTPAAGTTSPSASPTG